jgi:hypothetical protein
MSFRSQTSGYSITSEFTPLRQQRQREARAAFTPPSLSNQPQNPPPPSLQEDLNPLYIRTPHCTALHTTDLRTH